MIAVVLNPVAPNHGLTAHTCVCRDCQAIQVWMLPSATWQSDLELITCFRCRSAEPRSPATSPTPLMRT